MLNINLYLLTINSKPVEGLLISLIQITSKLVRPAQTAPTAVWPKFNLRKQIWKLDGFGNPSDPTDKNIRKMSIHYIQMSYNKT